MPSYALALQPPSFEQLALFELPIYGEEYRMFGEKGKGKVDGLTAFSGNEAII